MLLAVMEAFMEYPGNLRFSGETFSVGVKSPRSKVGGTLSSHTGHLLLGFF